MATQRAEVAAASGVALAEAAAVSTLVERVKKALRMVFRLLRPGVGSVRQGAVDAAVVVAAAQRVAATVGGAYATNSTRLVDPAAAYTAPSDFVPDLDELAAEFEAPVRGFIGGELTLDEAVEAAQQVAEERVRDAERDGRSRSFESSKSPKVTGYRRVIHPELSDGGTCGLCVVASERLYTRADLKPIHDRCNCTVMEATDDFDPGMRLNNADLGRVYEASGGTTDGRTLKQSRFQVSDSGHLQTRKERMKQGAAKRRRQAKPANGDRPAAPKPDKGETS